jgi:hypothetical protein
MPNDCWNNLTITGNKADINKIADVEFKDVPEWAFEIKKRGLEAVIIRLWSPWQPNYNRLEELIQTYKSCWIKNEWMEEGGSAGVWIGSYRSGEKLIQKMVWEDMCIEEEHKRFRTESIDRWDEDCGPEPEDLEGPIERNEL